MYLRSSRSLTTKTLWSGVSWTLATSHQDTPITRTAPSSAVSSHTAPRDITPPSHMTPEHVGFVLEIGLLWVGSRTRARRQARVWYRRCSSQGRADEHSPGRGLIERGQKADLQGRPCTSHQGALAQEPVLRRRARARRGFRFAQGRLRTEVSLETGERRWVWQVATLVAVVRTNNVQQQDTAQTPKSTKPGTTVTDGAPTMSSIATLGAGGRVIPLQRASTAGDLDEGSSSPTAGRGCRRSPSAAQRWLRELLRG